MTMMTVAMRAIEELIFFLLIDRYYDITAGIPKTIGFKIPPFPVIIYTTRRECSRNNIIDPVTINLNDSDTAQRQQQQ